MATLHRGKGDSLIISDSTGIKEIAGILIDIGLHRLPPISQAHIKGRSMWEDPCSSPFLELKDVPNHPTFLFIIGNYLR